MWGQPRTAVRRAQVGSGFPSWASGLHRLESMKGFYTVLAIVVGYLPILFFLLLFKWFRRSARKLKPRQLGSSVEFFVSPRMHILIQITLLLLVLFSLLVLSTSLRRGGDGWAVYSADSPRRNSPSHA